MESISHGATRNETFDIGEGLEGIKVLLYENYTKDNSEESLYAKEKEPNLNTSHLVAVTTTGENGRYEFKGVERANYTVVVEYNGVKYIQINNSVAKENGVQRANYNKQFTTILDDSSKENTESNTYGVTNAGIKLDYKYSNINEREFLKIGTRELPVSSEEGVILGDADGDKEITEMDIIKIGGIVAKLDTPASEQLKKQADLDKDGTISTSDWNILLKYFTREELIGSKYSYDFTKNDEWKKTWKNWNVETGKGEINDGSDYLKIDCGLEERIFDLSLGTDVKDATVSINSNSATYTYDDILDNKSENLCLSTLGIEELKSEEQQKLKQKLRRFYEGETKSSENDVNYNLYIYESDYNYRINDYLGTEAPQIDTDPSDDVAGQIATRNGAELDVNVRYKIDVTNQSLVASDVFVNEITDYFDKNYKLTNITYLGSDGKEKEIVLPKTIGEATIDGKEYNKVIIPIPKVNLGGTEADKVAKLTIYLTFNVNKNSESYIELGEKGNIAEITKYETSEGLIDMDSAPDNCIINKKLHYEDDTDEAEKLNVAVVTVPEGKTRSITGNVFDADKNTSVDDVIVQLIELKDLGNIQLEYIWQETRAGSNTVRKISDDGSKFEDYSVENSEGQYTFKGFIPGNYIVRFIYGDGKTYDIESEEYKDSAENVRTYNGQDYKSTVDKFYNQEWYNSNINNYVEGSSVARDNEARRLGVMANTAEIDNEIGNSIVAKDKNMLIATWMCAETSKIKVSVDTKDKTATQNESVIDVKFNNNLENKFENVNFGLELRPQTDLVLEKHITGLTLKASNPNAPTILDAKAEIKQILKDNSVEATGLKDGLSADKSTRENRGWWRLETDIEELAQGAQLQATYTYVVKNLGENDYLSKPLVYVYNTKKPSDYSSILQGLGTEIKNAIKNKTTYELGTYLGEFYYTGNVNTTTDTLVPTRAEEIEEAINNEMKFEEDVDLNPNFTKSLEKSGQERTIWKDTGSEINNEQVAIDTIVTSTSSTKSLIPYKNETTVEETRDFTKTLILSTTLVAGAEGTTLPSYIAEITRYSNAAGRADKNSVPGNLAYVHSDDANMTLNTFEDSEGTKYKYENVKEGDTWKEIWYKLNNANQYEKIEGVVEFSKEECKLTVAGTTITLIPYNEDDEFWGETIIITKPTGENKIAIVQIITIIASSMLILVVGIVLIKKFVIIKK